MAAAIPAAAPAGREKYARIAEKCDAPHSFPAVPGVHPVPYRKRGCAMSEKAKVILGCLSVAIMLAMAVPVPY